MRGSRFAFTLRGLLQLYAPPIDDCLLKVTDCRDGCVVNV